MTISIRFKNSTRKEIKQVSVVSVYPNPDSELAPELIIHFSTGAHRPEYIKMELIKDFSVLQSI